MLLRMSVMMPSDCSAFGLALLGGAECGRRGVLCPDLVCESGARQIKLRLQPKYGKSKEHPGEPWSWMERLFESQVHHLRIESKNERIDPF